MSLEKVIQENIFVSQKSATLFFYKPWKIKRTRKTLIFRAFWEAQTGFEPVHQGVADPRLTAWLLRHEHLATIFQSLMCNDPDGNRTRVTAVKGRCLNRLTTGPLYSHCLCSDHCLYYHSEIRNASTFFIKPYLHSLLSQTGSQKPSSPLQSALHF